MKIFHSMLNRKEFWSSLMVTLVPYLLNAQVKNTGLPIAISPGTTVTFTGSLHAAGNLNNEGTLIVQGDSIITGDYSGGGAVKLTGMEQKVAFGDAVLSSLTVAGGHKTLMADLHVNRLYFEDAKVLGNGYDVTVSTDISGANSQAYVAGKLIRAGGGSLYFPVGSSALFTPVLLDDIDGSDHQLGVAFKEDDPGGAPGPGLLAVASDKYWAVTQELGIFNGALITLPLSNESLVENANELAVAKAATIGSTFSGLGNSNLTGNLLNGTITAAEPSGAGIYTLGKYFDESLRVADSTALAEIYTATGGTAWINDAGWTTQNLNEWTGVEVADKRVKALDLSSNNLTGSFPEVADGLEELTTLDLSENALTGISSIANLTSLTYIDVSNNHLQFGSLEKVLVQAPQAIYAPQKEVLEKIRVLKEAGSSYTIDRTVTGTANSYSWYKDGEQQVEAAPFFAIDIEGFSVDGVYNAQVTNEKVPGLTLTTRPVTLRVSSLQRDSASLRAVYDALVTGSSSVSDWRTLPLAEWDEVTIANSRVVSVDLAGKQLSGQLPVDITDVQGLTVADFSSNEISGLPALEGSLPNLTSFDVSENKLEFDDLQPNATVTALDYSNQKPFGSPLNETISSGTDYQLSASVGGTGNQYQWWLSNEFGSRAVSVATSSTYTVPNIGIENMGDYVLKVTNPEVSDLTLQSHVQQVLASASLQITGIGTGGNTLTQGTGYALKVTERRPFDSTDVVSIAGDRFLFENLVLGDYIIALEGDDELYVPTYYGDTDLWTEADTFELRGGATGTINMTLKPGVTAGDGRVLGLVEAEIAGESSAEERVNARRKVKKAGCSMRRRTRGGGGRNLQEDVAWELVVYVETNDDGEFEFENIPAGYYRFNIEFPGIPMDPDSFVEFEIGAGGVENNTFILEAYITESGIEVTKIKELGFSRNYFKNLQIFPVPADEHLTMQYDELFATSVLLRLVNMQGQVMIERAIAGTSSRQIQLDVSRLPSGYYMLQFVDENRHGQSVMNYKLFIQH